jgi:hypothetical protein
MKSNLITKFKLFNLGQYIMIESCGWNDTTPKEWDSLMFFFLSIFSCCTKSDDQSQEDLAKSSYTTNRGIENLGILLHVGKPLQSIT